MQYAVFSYGKRNQINALSLFFTKMCNVCIVQLFKNIKTNTSLPFHSLNEREASKKSVTNEFEDTICKYVSAKSNFHSDSESGNSIQKVKKY